ncbi:hypothetical protein Hdeb2414_s0006g00222131 [Helianthus debilis subsp. tardiflorus]
MYEKYHSSILFQFSRYNIKSISFRLKIDLNCYFSSSGVGHFLSLVQKFYFSSVGPKMFHCCHFSPPATMKPFWIHRRKMKHLDH